ncbi:MAG: hypothetical protein JWN02_873 [Acidobacteria bacterium]|nr:hypothetical protein [Acidobacteriota bacterium]
MDALTRHGVEGRSRVHDLVKSDVSAAWKTARAIEHPWYRCQALSTVGAALKGPQAEVSLRQALAAAHELTEPNRIVTVASWPIGVFVRRGIGDVTAEVERLLSIIAAEPHTLRRGHALFSLLGAVFSDPRLRARVFAPLLPALTRSHGWRANRLMELTVVLMAAESPDAAAEVLRAMPEGRERRRAATFTKSSNGVP